MKTIISFAFMFIFSLALFAQNQVDLKLNLERNKTYRVKTTGEQTISQTIMDRQQNTEMKTTSTVSIKSIDSDANSTTAEVRFDTLNYSNSMPKMDIVSYKPGSLTSSNPSDALSTIFNRFSKSIFTVKLSTTGKVIEFVNLKNTIDSIKAGVDTLKGQTGMMVQMQCKTFLSEESMKGMIEMITAFLPGKKVQSGDKWDSEIKTSSNGIGILLKSNYKLKKINGKQAEIKGDVINEPASTLPLEINGAQITYDVRGLGEANLVVDTETGWIIKASSKSHSQGNIAVKAQGQDFQIPTEVDSTSETVAIH